MGTNADPPMEMTPPYTYTCDPVLPNVPENPGLFTQERLLTKTTIGNVSCMSDE